MSYIVPSQESDLRSVKSYYFFYFIAMGSILPFLSLFYTQAGLNKQEVGQIISIQLVVNLISTSFWSSIADAFQKHRIIVFAGLLGGFGAGLLLRFMDSFAGFSLGIALWSFSLAPVLPLVDSTTLDILGERKAEYGKHRVWGTIGWAIATTVVGFISGSFGLYTIFYCYAVALLFSFISTIKLPISQKPLKTSYRKGLQLFLSNWWLLSFLALLFIENGSATAANSFLYLYYQELGGGADLIGLSATISTISEIPMFYFSDKIFKRFTPSKLLLFSMVMWAIRLLLTSLLTNLYLLVALQLLHGLSFGAMWLAAVAYARSKATEGMGATAQGTMTAVLNLAAATGSSLWGYFYYTQGPSLTFRFAALAVAVAALAWGGVLWREKQTELV